MLVMGVDGCRDGWVGVALDRGRFAGATRFSHFEAVLEAVPEAEAIGVDIPIGLLPEGDRACDQLVRELLGPRRKSLFATPPRAALEAGSYDEANALTRTLSGHGLSTQSYALRRKVLEVDGVLRKQARGSGPPPAVPPAERQRRKAMYASNNREGLLRYARIIDRDAGALRAGAARERERLPAGRIIEVHPEASFCELNGGPLQHGKKSYNGIMQRMRLLQEAGLAVPTELGEVGKVSVDDVLDAAACAWTTYRYACGKARSLPPPGEWQRDGDRVVAIWI